MHLGERLVEETVSSSKKLQAMAEGVRQLPKAMEGLIPESQTFQVNKPQGHRATDISFRTEGSHGTQEVDFSGKESKEKIGRAHV